MIKIIVLGITVLFSLFLMMSFGFGWMSLDSQECSWSEYNIYTNLTGGTRIFNSCYVPMNDWITKTEKCGFLGFVCRDVEPYQKFISGGVCFKLNTGERC